MLKTLLAPAAVLLAVSFLSVIPFFWYGVPSGHDFEFHMYSWLEVQNQWHQGVLYPRWAALAHWGYGEARFLFYPPASWTLGAILGSVLPWKVVPGAYVVLVLFLAGLAMYVLVRKWLPARDALFAAAFYAVNPYHLVVVYWRSALAELLAAALLPLLLLCVMRLGKSGAMPVLWLGLVLAAAWLTNAPAAVIIHYSAALLALLHGVLERSWKPLWRLPLAVAMGAGLASFYLWPAIYEEKWVNIGQVLAPGVRPLDNFLFASISDPDHNRFNFLVSSVAAAEIVTVAVAALLSRRRRGELSRLWPLVAAWAGASAAIMLSFTGLLWQLLPKLQFVQLPWRFLLCLNVSLAILLPLAMPRWRARALLCVALLAVVVGAGHHFQPPWWDTALDIAEMQTAIADKTGYEGTDEYVPAGGDPYELNKDLPSVSGSSGKAIPVERANWSPAEERFLVKTDRPEVVTVRLFNYPAWEVAVNGRRVETQTADVTGLMMFPLAPGSADIRIRFVRTRDRTVGGVVSILSLLVFVTVSLWSTAGLTAPRNQAAAHPQ